MQPITVMKIELCEPSNQDPNYYGLRITEYDTDTPERVINIVEKSYFNRTGLIIAIEDLVTFTQCSIRFEEEAIINELK